MQLLSLMIRRIGTALNGNSLFPVASWGNSLGVSAGVHAAAFTLLAFVAMGTSLRPAPPDVMADFDVDQAAPPLEKTPLPTIQSGPSGGSTGDHMPLTAADTVPEPREPGISTEGTTAFDFDERLPRGKELAMSVFPFKTAPGRGLGTGIGNGIGDGVGDGVGQGNGGRFFNSAVVGRKFVYVIDSSGSMKEPHSEARTRLDRLKTELVRSIGDLPEDSEFFVIFFNIKAVPMPAEGLQRATRQNKLKYLGWVVKLQGGGGTDPVEAMKQAVELQPDVIYLLTDGVFDDKVPDRIAELNDVKRVAIHTFCLGDAKGEGMLESIARRNGGAYKFVP